MQQFFGATKAMTQVNFYSVSDEYGEFSNFAAYPITLKSQRWPTSEHYFQAQKFADKAYQNKIRAANTPMLAAQLGRARTQKLRRDWESVKVDIMREAVLAKFTQHGNLRQLLLATGAANLVEHTENDDYWGDGGDGRGKNMLGRVLMQTREILRGEDREFSGSIENKDER
jgi:N-glycosidase YbiA